jgi:hypothetical protein
MRRTLATRFFVALMECHLDWIISIGLNSLQPFFNIVYKNMNDAGMFADGVYNREIFQEFANIDEKTQTKGPE